jgi:tRNA dimethylallyltransferase
VALELARNLDGIELVAADSMQVYRGMDIGTAKPTLAEQASVPHHMIDVADAREDWSVSRWVTAARRAIEGIEARGHRALLVGGTGLYVEALIDALTPPGRYPEVRAELEGEPDTSALHRRLSEMDPVAAGRIQPSNRRRVIRALEVCIGSGRSFSGYGPGVASFPETTWRMAGIWLPRRVVAARIAERLRGMVEAGLVDEVRALVAGAGAGAGAGGGAGAENPLSRTARQALGYREVLAHLEGGIALGDAVEEAERRTRAFARRQRVWWRRDPRIRWYGAADNPFAVTAQLLGDWKVP